MDIHNMTEDLVIAEVNAICDSLKQDASSICTCPQCRQDAVCYILNRTVPYYVVSHRGASRMGNEMFANSQDKADLTALAYEGIRRVSHNQRPYFNHMEDKGSDTEILNTPAFNIPTIMGRVFNGLNFSPIAECMVELFQNNKLAAMKNPNWQNPFTLIPTTQGTFTFWPAPVPAENTEIRAVFEYTIKIRAQGLEELNHAFSIPVKSELFGNPSFSMERTFKLPDLYLFEPGEEKQQLVITE